MYFGNLIFFDGFNIITTELRDKNGGPTNRTRLDTIVFHTFVTMTLVNQINCRVVNATELNVFKTLFNNRWFWIVFLAEIFIQQMFLYGGSFTTGGSILGTVNLTPIQQSVCWFFALLGLAVNVAAKKIPVENFNFMKAIDLEAEEANDAITSLMNDGDKYFQRRYTQLTTDEDKDYGVEEIVEPTTTPGDYDDGYDAIN